jgi:hypothetical protein
MERHVESIHNRIPQRPERLTLEADFGVILRATGPAVGVRRPARSHGDPSSASDERLHVDFVETEKAKLGPTPA